MLTVCLTGGDCALKMHCRTFYFKSLYCLFHASRAHNIVPIELALIKLTRSHVDIRVRHFDYTLTTQYAVLRFW